MNIYISMYIYIDVYIIFIYIYISRERERESEPAKRTARDPSAAERSHGAEASGLRPGEVDPR